LGTTHFDRELFERVGRGKEGLKGKGKAFIDRLSSRGSLIIWVREREQDGKG